jgi:CYTH domain-containing protein
VTVEIERKFLVRCCPQDLCRYPSAYLSQGYLVSGPGGEVRIRSADGRCTLTAKSGTGMTRQEHEISISREQFEAMWPGTEGRRLEKRRYTIPAGSYSYALDLYLGSLAGLMTVEVEFDTVDDAMAFERPAWFGPEVTKDDSYKNAALAHRGLPKDAGSAP